MFWSLLCSWNTLDQFIEIPTHLKGHPLLCICAYIPMYLYTCLLATVAFLTVAPVFIMWDGLQVMTHPSSLVTLVKVHINPTQILFIWVQ